jgi:serine protease Do
VLFTLLLTACGGAGFRIDAPPLPRAEPAPEVSPLPPVDLGAQPVVEVVERVRPAVVNVRTDGGTGSGFIVDPEGVVVTNYHVVRGAAEIRVLTADVQRLDARPITADPNGDLAVLKVEAGSLPTVPLGDSDALRLGESVVALGFALALEGGPSVTSGIVSATGRTIEAQSGDVTETLEDLIQTDAAINPGNSGGPLLDLAGRVVGINTAGVSASAAENVGFAIAINRVRPIIERAIENPEAQLAYLGVSSRPIDELTAAELGLPVDRGLYITSVESGGPADEAGIQADDIIVRMDQHELVDNDDLLTAILAHEPGETAEVEVVHPDGSRETFTVTLAVRPDIPLN